MDLVTPAKKKKSPKVVTETPGTGKLPRVPLHSFPCGYCPVVKHCWEKAGYQFEIVDNKPVHWVTREAFEKSGIVVHRVAPVEPMPDEAVEPAAE